MGESERRGWIDRQRRHVAREQALSRRLGRLTRREREVLDLLTEGLRAAGIAERLVVSMPTVRSQIRSILTKLEVGSQLEAVALLHNTPTLRYAADASSFLSMPSTVSGTDDHGVTSTLARGLAVVVAGARTPAGLHDGVETLLADLATAGRPVHVVLVDDASRDLRSDEAEWLRWAHPERVEIVRHDFPEGRGPAERDGITAALAHCDHPMLLVAEVEDLPVSVPALLKEVDEARTEVVAGAGYRLYDRRLLEDLPPTGDVGA